MTGHEITIVNGIGRWYPKCRCGWELHTAIRNGDAEMRDGYFGRSTEAEARALADAHLDRQEEPVARRMQANPNASATSHGVEHNEIGACKYAPTCIPVPEGVTVPAIGTYLVTDGVVQLVLPEDINVDRYIHAGDKGPGNYYRIYVRDPKPTFFEEGKTYRREWAEGKKQTFRVDAVRFEDGNAIAFGRLETDDYGVDWVVRRQHHWDGDYGWKKAA